MLRTNQLLAIALLALATSSAAIAQAPRQDEQAIRDAFAEFKSHIVNDRGAGIEDVVCSSSVDYYDRVLDMARYAEVDELAAEPLMVMLNAIIARTQIPADELRRLSGPDLMARAVDRGWVLKNLLVGVNLDVVQVKDDRGAGGLIMNGQEIPGMILFCREGDGWACDMKAIIERAQAQFQGYVEQQERTPQEVVGWMMAEMFGKPLPDSVWNPPLERASGR